MQKAEMRAVGTPSAKPTTWGSDQLPGHYPILKVYTVCYLARAARNKGDCYQGLGNNLMQYYSPKNSIC